MQGDALKVATVFFRIHYAVYWIKLRAISLYNIPKMEKIFIKAVYSKLKGLAKSDSLISLMLKLMESQMNLHPIDE